MSAPYIGEIRMFGFFREPVDWLLCDGRLLEISQFTPLYILIGTRYGGDGQTTFALPDLRGRVPVHQGNGPGLSPYVLGQKAGAETVQLTASQMPAHNHVLQASTSGTRTATANGNLIGSGEADIFNRDGSNAVSLSPVQIGANAGSQPHENMQPSLCINFCIAWQGLFPPQS